MILKFLKRLATGRPYFLIQGYDQSPYLLRVLLWGTLHGDERDNGKKAWCSGYLHKFYREDFDEETHCHPWAWAFSIILKGGYDEERLVKDKIVKRTLRPFSINILTDKSFHRVTKLNGDDVWTLFITGHKKQDWGFYNLQEGYIPHQEFFKRRYAEEQLTT